LPGNPSPIRNIADPLFGTLPLGSRGARQFLDLVEKLRDEPVFILDLRIVFSPNFITHVKHLRFFGNCTLNLHSAHVDPGNKNFPKSIWAIILGWVTMIAPGVEADINVNAAPILWLDCQFIN